MRGSWRGLVPCCCCKPHGFGASWVLCGSFCQHLPCSYSAMLLGWAGSLVPRQLCRPGCCQNKIKPRGCPHGSLGTAKCCWSERDCRVSRWKAFQLPNGQAQPYLVIVPEGGALCPFPGAAVGLEGWWQRSCGLLGGIASVWAGAGCSNKSPPACQVTFPCMFCCCLGVLFSWSLVVWGRRGRERRLEQCLQELQWLLLLFMMMFCWSVLFFFPSEGLLVGFGSGRGPGVKECTPVFNGESYAGFAHWWGWKNPIEFHVSTCCGSVSLSYLVYGRERKQQLRFLPA